MAHSVFPLKALLAHGTGKGLLVRVREPVPVQVVDVSEGLPTGLTRVILAHHVSIWSWVHCPLLDTGARNRADTSKTNYGNSEDGDLPCSYSQSCRCRKLPNGSELRFQHCGTVT